MKTCQLLFKDLRLGVQSSLFLELCKDKVNGLVEIKRLLVKICWDCRKKMWNKDVWKYKEGRSV